MVDYNAEALDFLLPGVMDLEQVQARRIIYDRIYDLAIPTEKSGVDIIKFWSPVELDLHTVKVGSFQTVEITVCIVCSQGSNFGEYPYILTYRRVYMPVLYQRWSDYLAMTDDYHSLPHDLLYSKAGRETKLRRILVRLLPDPSMPVFWTEDPLKDFPLLEPGWREPAPHLLQNMKSATNSSEIAPSSNFTMKDVELLKKELDPRSQTLLKPLEYMVAPESDSHTRSRKLTPASKRGEDFYLAAPFVQKSVLFAHAIEIVNWQNHILRRDFPFDTHYDMDSTFTRKTRKHAFVYQNEESVRLLREVLESTD